MKQVGTTADNLKVCTGVFKFYDTYGIPLDTLFDLCKNENIMPSWLDFYNDAIENKWKYETIITRLSDSISDVWGKDYADAIIQKIKTAKKII
ncbi:MAG TPA: hypothetical protein VMV32_08440 [Ignavibacteriaceae bacterium]|nr:hypothetical protein [Ignavibacteriaceae bacterium]